jgi:thermostable 8-oxoguanine DNA glycosylase
MAAGKGAKAAKSTLDRLLAAARAGRDDLSPFAALRRVLRRMSLRVLLAAYRVGWRKRKAGAITELIRRKPELSTWTVEEAEAVPGIGPKTARLPILHSRPGQRLGCLDRHVLRWLAERGYNVPSATPSSRSRYSQIEQWFLAEADKLGKAPAALDLEIRIAAQQGEDDSPTDVDSERQEGRRARGH